MLNNLRQHAFDHRFFISFVANLDLRLTTKQNKNTLITNNHALRVESCGEGACTELVEGFRHSVPYINAHRGKTFVIMLGGEAIEHENFSSIVNDIGLLHSLGIRLVVVYGARPQIDANLAEHHHEPVYHKQTRVTDAKTLELVKQAAACCSWKLPRVCQRANNTLPQGAHINVVSGNFIIAQPLGVDDGVDCCHSGRIRRIDEEAIHRQLDNGAIVLMGPAAASVTGESQSDLGRDCHPAGREAEGGKEMIGFCSSQRGLQTVMG